MASDKELTVLGHLEDLRKRLMWVTLAVIIGTAVSFFFAEDIIDSLKSISDKVTLQSIDPTETIVTYFKLALTCGLVLATPVILFEAVMFLRPALTSREKKYLYTMLPGVLLAFGWEQRLLIWYCFRPQLISCSVLAVMWRKSNGGSANILHLSPGLSSL